MRERKYVKFKTDMHEDTKFKIIDRMHERDLVQYLWTRFVALAAKVNREGDLYLSRNILYTIETLAIEFNRSVEQVKLAVDVFMQLEMLELTEHNVYRVKNFAKHQNIKVKEKIEPVAKEEEIKNKEIQVKEILENEIDEVEDKEFESRTSKNERYQEENIKSVEIVINDEDDNNKENDSFEIINKDNNNEDYSSKDGKDENDLEITNKDKNEIDTNVSNEKNSKNLQDNVPILLEVKKNNKAKGRKKKDTPFEITDEEIEVDPVSGFWDGEALIGEDDKVIMKLTFD